MLSHATALETRDDSPSVTNSGYPKYASARSFIITTKNSTAAATRTASPDRLSRSNRHGHRRRLAPLLPRSLEPGPCYRPYRARCRHPLRSPLRRNITRRRRRVGTHLRCQWRYLPGTPFAAAQRHRGKSQIVPTPTPQTRNPPRSLHPANSHK
jgi:hypothetical protein